MENREILEAMLNAYVKQDKELRKFGCLYDDSCFDAVEGVMDKFIIEICDILYSDIQWKYTQNNNYDVGTLVLHRGMQECGYKDGDFIIVDDKASREEFFKELEKMIKEKSSNKDIIKSFHIGTIDKLPKKNSIVEVGKLYFDFETGALHICIDGMGKGEGL